MVDRRTELENFLSGESPLPEEKRAIAESTLWILQEELMFLWHRTHKRGLISEILSLAHRLQSLGREKGLDILTIYGQELEEKTLDFEIEVTESMLEIYPRLVNRISGWCG